MEVVFGVILALALVIGFPAAAIVALVRSADLKRRIEAAELRQKSLETEVALMREALSRSAGRPPPAEPAPAAEAAPEQPGPAEPGPEAPEAEAAPVRRTVPAVASREPLEAVDPALSEAAPAAPVPPADLGGLEERIGSRWAVWVGALALGLGGLFLVRYSIEQGLLGPGTRIALGALFALALLAAGEWLRRKDRGLPTLPVADIPSAVTGAGAVAAFGTVYAAHALYGFIGPATAFLLLGAVGLGTLVLAGLHGPLLGGVGLVAAFAAPFLVSAEEPSPYTLPLYAAVITAAAFALAWIRTWSWLFLAAAAASAGVGLLALAGIGGAALPVLLQAAAGIAAAGAFLVPGVWLAAGRERGIDAVAVAVLCAFVLLGAVAAADGHRDTVALILYGALAVAVMAFAGRTAAVAPAVPAGGLATLLVMASWVGGVRPSALVADPLGVPPDFPAELARIVWAGLAFALLYGIGPAVLAVWRRQREAGTVLMLAATSVAMPLALLAIVYGKVEGFVVSPRFAALAMVLAASFGAAAEAAHRLRSGRRPGLAGAAAVYAIGALAALAFALALLLERGWLTLALAAMIAAIAWVYALRPLPQLRWAAALAGLGVLARLAWDPAINGPDVGETVVFNWLLPGYGLPALSAAAAAVLLRRRRGEDAPVQILEALAMVFAALLLIVQVRHAFGAAGDRLLLGRMGFAEAATHTAAILAYGLGLSRLAAIRTGALWRNALLIVRYASWAWIAAVMGVLANPWLTGAPIGAHPVINWALLGYGCGAVLAGLACFFERRAGRRAEARIMGLFGLAMGFLYLNMTVAALFRGPVLTRGAVGDAELYAYSALWLAIGMALLGAGAVLGSRTLRLASAALVALAALKVFLVDMGGLTGLWRALSFIGLGLTLILIGRIYQRVLGIAGARPPAPAAGPPPG